MICYLYSMTHVNSQITCSFEVRELVVIIALGEFECLNLLKYLIHAVPNLGSREQLCIHDKVCFVEKHIQMSAICCVESVLVPIILILLVSHVCPLSLSLSLSIYIYIYILTNQINPFIHTSPHWTKESVIKRTFNEKPLHAIECRKYNRWR